MVTSVSRVTGRKCFNITIWDSFSPILIIEGKVNWSAIKQIKREEKRKETPLLFVKEEQM